MTVYNRICFCISPERAVTYDLFVRLSVCLSIYTCISAAPIGRNFINFTLGTLMKKNKSRAIYTGP
jgi:hypothetical protein